MVYQINGSHKWLPFLCISVVHMRVRLLCQRSVVVLWLFGLFYWLFDG